MQKHQPDSYLAVCATGLVKGGNEYKEERALKRSYRCQRKIRQLYCHSYISDNARGAQGVTEETDFEEVDEDQEEWENKRNDGEENESHTNLLWEVFSAACGALNGH